jgi:hypothetical protein
MVIVKAFVINCVMNWEEFAFLYSTKRVIRICSVTQNVE